MDDHTHWLGYMKFTPFVVFGIYAVIGWVQRARDQRAHPMPANLSDEHIEAAAKAGHRAPAIRWYRTLHGGSLRNAMRVVDALADRQEGNQDSKQDRKSDDV